MEKQFLIDEREHEDKSETSQQTNNKILIPIIFSKDLGIVSYFDENQKLNKNIVAKLSKFAFFLNIEENSDKNENFVNYKYKKDNKKFKYFNKDFTFIKTDKNFKQINEIKEFIININNYSLKYEIIFRIIIKKGKKKIDIYLGFNNELTKYIFKFDNSQSIYEIFQHCIQNKIELIEFDMEKDIKKNYINDSLCSKFFDMIKNHNKENEKNKEENKENIFQFFDPMLPNYRDFNSNTSVISKDLSDLFDDRIHISSFTIDFEKFEEEKKIKEIPLECGGDQKELKIFIMNLKFFLDKNHNNSSYMIILEKNAQFPVIYVQINLELFKITFKEPGLSPDKFRLFCEDKAHMRIYVKAHDN